MELSLPFNIPLKKCFGLNPLTGSASERPFRIG
jgi:hypothetical protein